VSRERFAYYAFRVASARDVAAANPRCGGLSSEPPDRLSGLQSPVGYGTAPA